MQRPHVSPFLAIFAPMKHFLPIISLFLCQALTGTAQNEVIDISGNNTASSYVSYDKTFSIAAGKAVDVKMARYCYFSSTITGSGTLNLYAGGERCYLGTEKGAAWPNWNGFRGDIHVYPFPENSSSAGFYGVVLAHGGKSFSPENVAEAVKSGKVNTSMQTNHVVLHRGATICCEANTSGAGFRIGELQTEEGSTVQGYMKKNTRAAYFMVGCLNTSATLAGTIAPPDYSDTHPLGLIKEGTGTYRITGNQNYLSAALRVLAGRVLVCNDRAEAESKKLRGALGARPTDTDPIAYVFQGGVLGGTGSIGGTVDNYGTVEPGDGAPGVLTLQNYAAPTKSAHLVMHPASVLRFKVGATGADELHVAGSVKFSDMTEDFQTSSKMPQVALTLDENATPAVGTEYVLLTAKAKDQKTAQWHFELQKPAHHTWKLEEEEQDGSYRLKLRLVSLNDDAGEDNPDDPEQPETPQSTMGAFYDDGIDDQADKTALRTYAQQNGKLIGTAISTWKTDITNESLAETKEIAAQFNLLAPENEMKMDALQPNRGEYSFWAADNLVNFAQRHQMQLRGHCLVWHMQQPQWLSSDGKKNDKNWSRQEALAIMKDHIETVMKHFKGKVKEWDVVNECLDDDQSIIRTQPDAYTLRPTVWQRAIGDDYIDSAFVYAHRADPDVLLYLNDYDVELQGKAKSVAFYNLLMRLKKNGVPVDGAGLQCHFSVGQVDSAKLAGTVHRMGEAGLRCVITELDMGISSTTAANLEQQALNYRVVTDVVLNNDNCPYMVVWGLKDNDSWRSSSSPLLYTAGLAKKPAFYAVRSALRHRVLQKESAGLVPVADSRQQQQSAVVYDLWGRKTNAWQLKPGIYVSEGRKFVVGGKL